MSPRVTPHQPCGQMLLCEGNTSEGHLGLEQDYSCSRPFAVRTRLERKQMDQLVLIAQTPSTTALASPGQPLPSQSTVCPKSSLSSARGGSSSAMPLWIGDLR